jgi:peptidoglycan/LPS O-acetylase OafA/YrhL
MESVGFACFAFFYVLILLLALTRPAEAIARFARAHWLCALGGVSYCSVVDEIFRTFLRQAQPGTSDWRRLAVTIFAGSATYGIARLSWVLLENPLLRRGHQYEY